jgi:O-6-methylguanine DNA methyltransferase
MTVRSTPQTDNTDLEAALAGLAVAAPPTLAPASLLAVGLADEYAPMASPIGPAAFEARVRAASGRPIHPAASIPPRLERALARRLAGDRRAPIALDLRERTEFERAVWSKALEIPRGEVRPYGWIAAEIGRPKAVRAVGSALGHNPIPLVIPCHRVVRSDGLIGQYSLGGPGNKRTMLAAEGLDPDELETQARAGIRYIGSDTTRIFCLPSCHHARRVTAAHRVPLRSGAAAAAAGYRACRVCRPDSALRAA